MKTINYSFSNSDIEAVTSALEALAYYSFFDDEPDGQEKLFDIIQSVGIKLLSHSPLDQKDAYYIAFSIDCAYKSLRDELSIEDEGKQIISPYIFTINKLQPIFSPILSE